MKTNFLSFAAALPVMLALALLPSEKAHAWGQYGHEQVNDAAIDLLGTGNGLGKCLDQARYTVKRYAITPDVEWKTDMTLKTLSKPDYEKRLEDNQYEHSLHFDEVDAWVPNPKPGEIARLPAGEYADVFSFYRDKLRQNASYVTSIDPSKTLKDPSNPSVNEVTSHGTAPWRALQLYRLGVDALKRGDTKAALLYLGTMGHYVGDMSQPFHASLNYDGGHYPTAAAGIHHEIDTRTLPVNGKDASEVYPSFEQTAPGVMAAAKDELGGGVGGLKENQIVPEILGVVDRGYGDVESFLKTYSEECALAQGGQNAAHIKEKCDPNNPTSTCESEPKTVRKVMRHQVRGAKDSPTAGNGGHGAAPTRTEGDYCVVPPAAPGEREPSARPIPAAIDRDFAAKVVPELEKRMGASAALLARIWASAYAAAGKPALSGCDGITFDQTYAIQNYPKPNDDNAHGYMPQGYVPERPK